MIALITDSNAMLPDWLAARFDVTIVPLHATVDGVSLREDDDLDLGAFYARLRAGASVTTSAPAPGDFVRVYEALAGSGATDIVSVHVGSAYSGTLNAAQVAAPLAGIPVHLVDSGTASFALGCCVWAAADARADTDDVGAIIAAAQQPPATTTSVFTVGEIARAQAGGRVDVAVVSAGVPVVAMNATATIQLAPATDVAGAVHEMTEHLRGQLCGPARIGVGDADVPDAGDALAEALATLPGVRDLVRYRIGPTVAAHTGVGTFGAVAWQLSD